MVAARRSDVDDLNERARRRLAAAGRLTGPAVTDANGRDFQTGDHIMALRNDRRLRVINGSRGTVTAVDSDQRSVTVRLTDHRQVILPAGYLDAGHLTHGYAITGHKAQGLTTDQAWVLGSDNLYREWGYVAMSRARHHTRLYLVDHRGNDHTDDLHRHGSLHNTRDPLLAAAATLDRSRAQHLASDTPTPDPPPALADLRQHAATIRRRLYATMPPPVDRQQQRLDERRAELDRGLADATTRLVHAQEQAAELRRGLGRLTRRDAIQAADRHLTRSQANVAAWSSQSEQLNIETEKLQEQAQRHLAWAQDHHQDLNDYATTLRLLDNTQRARRTITELDPPPATIEDRPDQPSQRHAWRQQLYDNTLGRDMGHDTSRELIELDIA
jgi:hypothetical protein